MAGAERDLRFDLVVATVDRTTDLETFLDSLEEQTHRHFRVVVVDQNADGRVTELLASHHALEVTHLRSQRGLSRARNVGLCALTGDVVAFPDDDCRYAPDLLERVARRFAGDQALDGLTGRAVGDDGATDHPGSRTRRCWSRTSVESRDLVHDLPAAGARRTGRDLRRAARSRGGIALVVR